MRKYINLLLKLLISIALFIVFVAFTETKQSKTSENFIAGHESGHRHSHHRHYHRGRHYRGNGVEFRSHIGPRDRRYYEGPYYRSYIRVNCRVFDTRYSKVTEIQLGGRSIYVNSGIRGNYYYFSLRPGYHILRWRVETEDKYGVVRSKYYSRNFRLHRDREQINITIKGSSSSIY